MPQLAGGNDREPAPAELPGQDKSRRPPQDLPGTVKRLMGRGNNRKPIPPMANGDGHAELITAAGPTGGPNVIVFDGSNLANQMDNFFAYDQNFLGGVFVGGL
jgi:hypothetical protein